MVRSPRDGPNLKGEPCPGEDTAPPDNEAIVTGQFTDTDFVLRVSFEIRTVGTLPIRCKECAGGAWPIRVFGSSQQVTLVAHRPECAVGKRCSAFWIELPSAFRSVPIRVGPKPASGRSPRGSRRPPSQPLGMPRTWVPMWTQPVNHDEPREAPTVGGCSHCPAITEEQRRPSGLPEIDLATRGAWHADSCWLLQPDATPIDEEAGQE